MVLDVALKEWSVVCDLLLEGRLAVLLRKGGIHESGGPGVFELDHSRFALFPSWAHQKPEGIQPEHRHRVERLDEPDSVTIRGLAEVVAIHEVNDRANLEPIADLLCWTDSYLDMRFNYKPDRPLYMIVVQVYRLPAPVELANDREYCGCRSWVPLRPTDTINDSQATSVLNPDALQTIRDRVARSLQQDT